MAGVRLLAVDPGRVTGWALFRDGFLVDCGKTPNGRDLPPADEVVIERPVIRKRHPRPDDILKLAMLAAAIGERYTRAKVTFVKPEEWKGQLPKGVCWHRACKALAPDELDAARGTDHNTHDAIALGLSHLGRFHK